MGACLASTVTPFAAPPPVTTGAPSSVVPAASVPASVSRAAEPAVGRVHPHPISMNALTIQLAVRRPFAPLIARAYREPSVTTSPRPLTTTPPAAAAAATATAAAVAGTIPAAALDSPVAISASPSASTPPPSSSPSFASLWAQPDIKTDYPPTPRLPPMAVATITARKRQPSGRLDTTTDGWIYRVIPGLLTGAWEWSDFISEETSAVTRPVKRWGPVYLTWRALANVPHKGSVVGSTECHDKGEPVRLTLAGSYDLAVGEADVSLYRNTNQSKPVLRYRFRIFHPAHSTESRDIELKGTRIAAVTGAPPTDSSAAVDNAVRSSPPVTLKRVQSKPMPVPAHVTLPPLRGFRS